MNTGTLRDFNLPEEVVAEKTGLTLADVKSARGPAGIRWKKCANSRVLWCVVGLQELEAELAKKAHSNAEPQLEEKAPRIETFTVARVRTLRCLHVVREGQRYDPLLPVNLWLPQPKGNLFRLGMRVAGRARHGSNRLYDFEGNPDALDKGRRMPRRAGMW